MPAKKPCFGRCDDVEDNKENDNFSHFMFRVGHVSVFTIPSTRRVLVYLYMIALFTAWAFLTSTAMKKRALFASFLYTFIEYGFTFFHDGAAFTSLAQFLANVIYTPIAVDVYSNFLHESPVAFVLLYPLNIWVLEIVETLLLICPWHGRNVAWCYCKQSGCGFGGAIRSPQAPFWVLMGIFSWVIWPTMKAWTSF